MNIYIVTLRWGTHIRILGAFSTKDKAILVANGFNKSDELGSADVGRWTVDLLSADTRPYWTTTMFLVNGRQRGRIKQFIDEGGTECLTVGDDGEIVPCGDGVRVSGVYTDTDDEEYVYADSYSSAEHAIEVAEALRQKTLADRAVK